MRPENFGKYKSSINHLFVFTNGSPTGKTIAMSDTDGFEQFLQKVNEVFPSFTNNYEIYLPSIKMNVEEQDFFGFINARDTIVLIPHGESYRGYMDHVINKKNESVLFQPCCMIS
jgi:hypothetical protein